MSPRSVTRAAARPAARSTLVAPMLPLSWRRMSPTPAARATRKPIGTAPIRHAAPSARARPPTSGRPRARGVRGAPDGGGEGAENGPPGLAPDDHHDDPGRDLVDREQRDQRRGDEE